MNKNFELPSATLLENLREFVESDAWRETKADIPVILGKDASGNLKIADLATAPHMFVAGQTGSGKSVFLNTLITSLLYRSSPDELKLILVDPMYVDFEQWCTLPHLITPVVNDPAKVPDILRWAVREMEYRYRVMARILAKNLKTFNSRPQDPEPVMDETGKPVPQKLPRLIIIVSELADMMRSDTWKDVETLICRIAQRGRAAGIHLVISTQTPSRDVFTSIIKANMPTRLAFRVCQDRDSRLILDSPGAEKLLGKGDMLFRFLGKEPQRIQVPMMSDSAIQNVVNFVSSQAEQHFDPAVILGNQGKDGGETDKRDVFLDEVTDRYLQPVMALIEEKKGNDDELNDFLDEIIYDYLEPLMSLIEGKKEEEKGKADEQNDPLNEMIRKYLQPGDDEDMRKALEVILREGKAATSYLQRRLGISYNKACEIIDTLEQHGIVSAPLPGDQKRNILIQVNTDTPSETN